MLVRRWLELSGGRPAARPAASIAIGKGGQEHGSGIGEAFRIHGGALGENRENESRSALTPALRFLRNFALLKLRCAASVSDALALVIDENNRGDFGRPG